MTKMSIQYTIFLVILTNIVAASASLAAYLIFQTHENNSSNNKDRNLFFLAHAQSSTEANTTLILNLHKQNDQLMKNTINYDITNISSNDIRLQDITLVKEDVPIVTIANDVMNAFFTLHMPDATNPNKVLVKPTVIYFPVDSIETKPDGNKIYHGKSDISTTTIGDNVPVGKEALLTETSPSEAQMTVFINNE